MRKRYFVFICLCLMACIMTACSHKPEDGISIRYSTWDLDPFWSEFTDLHSLYDDQPLYSYIIKEAQFDISAVMNGEVLSPSSSMMLEADDPTVVKMTSIPSEMSVPSLAKKLEVLRPEARQANLTLTLNSGSQIETKKIVLVLAKRIDLQEGVQAIDFDTAEIVTESQWEAMDAVQQASFDLMLNRRLIDTGSDFTCKINLDFPYGYLSFPSRLFAVYAFYPESDNLPADDYEAKWESADPSDMFILETSAGRIYKILLTGRWINYIEILKQPE